MDIDKDLQCRRMIWPRCSTHLRQINYLFGRALDEDLVFNLDYMHFVLDWDNEKAFEILGKSKRNYAEVSNGSKKFTVATFVSERAKARIESVFMIFKNPNGSYPIAGVPYEPQFVEERRDGWTVVCSVKC